MQSPALRLVPGLPELPPPPPDVARAACTFADALAAARERGAHPDALIAHLVPLVRFASVHGTPRELAGHLQALVSLAGPAPALQLADSLARTGRRAAAARIRTLLTRRRFFLRRPYPDA